MSRCTETPVITPAPVEHGRPYLLEHVDDAAVVQLYADGFSDLPLGDKVLVWHLTRGAIAGRDIFYDQQYAHNLEAVRGEAGDIVDVTISYPLDLTSQMLEYSAATRHLRVS